MTYSIVARCPSTGQLGVAVQSHFFAVGRLVPWVAAGLGAVATQAMVDVSYGKQGLARLRAGSSPEAALAAMVEADHGSATRQVGIVDAVGRVAAHTGASCIREAGHVVGDGFATHANMMKRRGVAETMAAAFTADDGPLWIRMLAALDAAEARGGDIRGRQSAALVITTAVSADGIGDGLLVDARVDDHPDPLAELRRLTALGVAYHRLGDAEALLTCGSVDEAVEVYEEVVADHPDHVEFAFWYAVSLASTGRLDDARAAIAPAFDGAEAERWRELLRRLPDAGLTDEAAVAALLG